MNKKLYLIYFYLVTNLVGLNAKIVEIKNISEVHDYINSDKKSSTLVLLDIDNTLTEPVDDHGGDLWFSASVKKEMEKGLNQVDAVHKVLPTYVKIQKKIKVKPVEDKTVEVVHSLQNQKIPMLALTSRSGVVLDCAYKQLKSIRISLEPVGLWKKMISLQNQKFPAFYYKGMIGCDQNSKGQCLKEFLDMAKKRWSILSDITNIVFIDDKEKYLKETEEVLKNSKISFTGLRYSYLDEKVKNYVLKDNAEEKVSFFTATKNKVVAFFSHPFVKRKVVL